MTSESRGFVDVQIASASTSPRSPTKIEACIAISLQQPGTPGQHPAGWAVRVSYAKGSTVPKPTSGATGWQCPECGRSFARRTREHSCEITSIEKHLDKASPELRAAFEALQAAMRRIGPYQTNALKTMITFSRDRNFAGLTVTKNRLDLGFFLPRRLQHARITRVEPISPRKIAHHVQLHAPSDVDAELVAWLEEAYATGAAGS